jgi:hypothetical protein
MSAPETTSDPDRSGSDGPGVAPVDARHAGNGQFAPERQVAVLQERIRESLDVLRPIPPGTPAYAAAARDVLVATAELIEFEERLPVLLDEPRHRISLLTVRWTGAVVAVVSVLLALAVLPDWVTPAWLGLLLPMLVLGGRMYLLPVHPPCGPHVRQRIGAAAVAAAVPFAVFAVTGLAPPWLAAVAVLLAGAGTTYLLRPPVDESGEDDDEGVEEEEPDPPEEPPPTPPTGLVMPP